MNDTIEKEPAKDQVELPAAAETAEADAPPTRADAEKAGWSEKEIASAEKLGMFGKPKKDEPAPAPAKGPEPGKPEAAAPGKPAPEPETETKPKPAGGIPDFNLTPELEAEFERLFGKGTPVRGLYFRMKSERQTRQRLEQEINALKAQIAGKPPAPATPGPEEEEELDKPLTPRMLREWQKQQAEEAEKEKQLRAEHEVVLVNAQKEQEAYAREVLPDYQEASDLARDVMRNLDALFPEPRRRQRALQLIEDFQVACYRANQLGLEDRHAAFIIHELGQMHPNYGKAPAKPAGDPPTKTGPSKEIPKAPGSQKPETTLERIERHSQSRASSAAVQGGAGKRVVSAEDVTVTDLNAMDFKQRKAFRDKFPAQYAKLMRG